MNTFMMAFLVILIPLISHAQDIEFDMSLLREWNQDSRPEFTPPYVYKNSKNNKTLWYIGVSHSTNFSSPSFKLIEQSIKEFRPDIIIVEGIPSSLGLSNDKVLIDAENCMKVSNCGEPMYAINLAQKQKIPFIGGEPDRKEEINKLKKDGFPEEDILFFYFARNLMGKNRSGQLSEMNITQIYAQELLKYKDQQESRYSFDNFKKWYKTTLSKEFVISTLNDQDFAPFKSGHKINKVAHGIDGTREQNILSVIEKQINKNKKVLVIYGSSHLYKHQKVLDDAFEKKEVAHEDTHINSGLRGSDKTFAAPKNSKVMTHASGSHQ